MIKPKQPYDDLISDMMRENVKRFENLYEKEFEKVTDVKFPDRVTKRPSARILDDDQIKTYEFYVLNHGDGMKVEIHQLEQPYLSHRSPDESSTYQFVVSKIFPHRAYSQFMTHEQAVDYWKTLVSGGWKRGENVKHKVRGKIALRLADGYDWKEHEGTYNR